MMQQRGEPHTLTLSRRLAHGCQSIRRGSPGAASGPRLSDRRFPWAGSFPPRPPPRAKPSLFGRFSGTVTPSDF